MKDIFLKSESLMFLTSLYFCFSLSQWFSHLRCIQIKGSWKCRLLGPTPNLRFSNFRLEPRNSHFKKFPGMLMLLVGDYILSSQLFLSFVCIFFVWHLHFLISKNIFYFLLSSDFFLFLSIEEKLPRISLRILSRFFF